uniref:Uncharacterized protein n=1 Tax=Panagrolaimus sp. PS1159 TaxID=55785 RepID=A0AC35GB38_9BILA
MKNTKLESDQSGDVAESNKLQIQIDQINEICNKKVLDRCHDSLGITAINQRNRDTQQQSTPTQHIPTTPTSTTKPSGISFAEFRRRKAEAGN